MANATVLELDLAFEAQSPRSNGIVFDTADGRSHHVRLVKVYDYVCEWSSVGIVAAFEDARGDQYLFPFRFAEGGLQHESAGYGGSNFGFIARLASNGIEEADFIEHARELLKQHDWQAEALELADSED